MATDADFQFVCDNCQDVIPAVPFSSRGRYILLRCEKCDHEELLDTDPEHITLELFSVVEVRSKGEVEA